MEITRARAVNAFLLAALERPADERAVFLDEVCQDPDLRQEVEGLLALENEILQIFDRPILEHEDDEIDLDDQQRKIGPYRVLRRLGHGGMGTVYLATRPDAARCGLPEEVAIKILRPGLSDEVARRFRNESRILATLDHPGIARLFEDGALEDGRPYLVMEYVDGERIDRFCATREWSVRQRLELFVEVCKIVAFAHRQRVIHRDLKPSNILITDDGKPKLLDFGIAKLLDMEGGEPATVTATGMQALTPQYASPEQIAGERVTVASDVFSLGIVLYELLSGQRPSRFTEGSRSGPSAPRFLPLVGDDEVTVTSQRVLPPLARLFRPSSSMAHLDAVLRKTLRLEPAERYSSVTELAKDVRRHLAGRVTAAHRERLRRRRRRALVLVACLFPLFFIGRDSPQKTSTMYRVANSGFEAGAADGVIEAWGPDGTWWSHANHPTPGNADLGERFAVRSAEAGAFLGQILPQRFVPSTAYRFRSWAAAGQDHHGRLPYQIGYAAVDGDLSSFIPLATRLVDLEGTTAWQRTEGVSYETREAGSELGRQIVLCFGNVTHGGASDVFIDEVELHSWPLGPRGSSAQTR